MRRADERRKYEVRRLLLDTCDQRAEIVDVQREEFYCHVLGALVPKEFLHPLRRDRSVVVVGSNDVALLAEFFHCRGNHHLKLLSRRDPGVIEEPIADAAFVERIIEVEST